MSTSQKSDCSLVSVTETEIAALISCARTRLVVIAPGLSEFLAAAVVERWRALGPTGTHVVLDSDPEVCRLGLGEFAALKLLHGVAEEIGGCVYLQRGLRVGMIVTDETITIYAPTPLLTEAGGTKGEKHNAIRLEDSHAMQSGPNSVSELSVANIDAVPMSGGDVQSTANALRSNPPLSFDIARKVRVFNSRIEFVEFELRGTALSRKTVPLPADLMGFAKSPRAQKLLRSSFQIIESDAELSGERIIKIKRAIVKRYLTILPGHGTVILRDHKADFLMAVRALERYIHRFQRRQKKRLQTAIDQNRELVISALLPGVCANIPKRWQRGMRSNATPQEVERALRTELECAFGSVEDILSNMNVSVLFKGVTYESLTDADFLSTTQRLIPSLASIHEEFDAAPEARRAAAEN